MKTFKITAIVLTLILLVTLGIGAAMVSAQETEDGTVCGPFRGMLVRRAGLSEEDQAELEARRTEMEATRGRWDALTDEQKEEIYGIEDQIGALRERIVDRYQQWGVYNEETATQFREQISERLGQMREDGRMPVGGFGRRSGQRGGFCGAAGPTSAEE